MKLFLILLVICCLPAIWTVAQETDYHPLLKEGKVWECRNDRQRGDKEIRGDYAYMIHGDTIIDGISYKKVLLWDSFMYDDSDWHYYGGAREDGQRVFFLPEGYNDELKLYDFGISPNDTINYFHHYAANGDFHIIIHQISSRPLNDKTSRKEVVWRANFHGSPMVSNNHFYWIESIGDERDPWNNQLWFIGPGGVQACYEDGICIYGNPGVVKVHSPSIVNSKLSNGQCFDLTGRRLLAPPRKGVYIEDGKVKVRQ